MSDKNTAETLMGSGGHHGCCGDDPDICHCECHDPVMGKYTSHIAPCCFGCEYCGQAIKADSHLLHQKRCKEEHGGKKMPEPVALEHPRKFNVRSEENFDDISHVDTGEDRASYPGS